jgi:hypothetical protein
VLKVNAAMLCSALVLSSFSLQGHASFVDLGTTTVDTSSNLEWLDLTESMGYSFNQVVNDNIFPTWRYATLSELQALYSGFGFNVERAYYQPASNGPQGASIWQPACWATPMAILLGKREALAASLLQPGLPRTRTRSSGVSVSKRGPTSHPTAPTWL